MRWIIGVLLLVLGEVAALGQSARPKVSVATLADLMAKKPAVDGEEVEVQNGSTNIVWSKPRVYRHLPTATDAHDGKNVLTNALGRGRYVAVDRTSAEQLAEYHLVPYDGSTDGSAAFQSALDYCRSNNLPTLKLPAGRIIIGGIAVTGVLDLGGLSIVGSPGQKSILQAANASTMLRISGYRNVQIEHIRFEGVNLSTNLLELDNATQANIADCSFYESARVGARMVGVQNYGHAIDRCNFVNNRFGLVFDGQSTAMNMVSLCVFQNYNTNFTDSVGCWIRRGSVKEVFLGTIFQNLAEGIRIDGDDSGVQMSTDVAYSYFEKCTTRPIPLGSGLSINLSIHNTIFNQQFTPDGWCVKDSPGSTVYGLTWRENTVAPDVGKALSLTNTTASTRGWRIQTGPTDIATDYELPPQAVVIWETPSQRLLSGIVTNWNATTSTNYQIAGDLLPNHLSVSSQSNITVSVIGYTYRGTEFTLRNWGTNQVTFAGTLDAVYPGQEQTFVYGSSGSWFKRVGPYLPDSGGPTLRGSLTVTNALSVGGTLNVTGNATFVGTINNPLGYLSYGGYGSPSTNLFVVAAKAGAVVAIQKDGDNYAFFGTNGASTFVKPIETVAQANTLAYFAGWTSNPATGPARQYSMSLGGLAAALGVASGSTNRYVEQDINQTNSPITINNALSTFYNFTGASTSTGVRLYMLPTNDVARGAKLTVAIQGTNVHGYLPLQYWFAVPGVETNEIPEASKLSWVWTGSTWVKEQWWDNAFPENGYIYGIYNRTPIEIPIQSDAPFDGLEYVRKNQAWAVASGGGGGGGTNHNALSGLQGGTSGEYYHLTSAQHTDLTDAGDSALHYHSSDRSRANHTGSQLMATISDWATNVWSKLTSVFQRGNGVHFATNDGANTLTISGWYLPGANVTFTTNVDGSITVASASGGSTNGTPLSVNGGGILTLANLLDTVIAKWTASGSNITLTITNLPQAAVSNLVADLAAKQNANTNLLQIATAAGTPGDVLYRHSSGVLTNLPVGTNGQVLTVASGAPSWATPTTGGGGGATNATYTTNKVDVPVYVSTDTVTVSNTTTNETSLVGTLKAGQSKMTAANTLVSGTVIRVRAHGTLAAAGDWSNGRFRVKIGSRVLDAQLYEPDSLTPSGLPWEITAYLHVNAAGSSASNTVVGVLSYGHGSAGSVGANMLNMAASGSLNTTVTNAIDVTFQNDGTQPVTLTCSAVEVYRLSDELVTGGSGLVFANGALVANPNFTDGTGLNLTVTNATNVVVELEDSGVTAQQTEHLTVDAKGRVTAVTKPWERTYIWTEFYNQNGVTAASSSAWPWGGFALAAGTALASDVISTNHPGITRIQSSASVNSGYAFGFRPTAMYMDQGYSTDFIVRPLQSDTNYTARVGFLNSWAVGGATQGVVVNFNGGYITLQSYTGSTTANTHSVSNAYSTNTWYRGTLTVDADGSRGVTVEIVESDTGNSVMSTTWSNIPARTTAVSHGAAAWHGTGGTVNIVDWDFLGLMHNTVRR